MMALRNSFADPNPTHMKHLKFLPFVLLTLPLLNGCGVNQAFVFNQNQNSTQVHLSEANFRNVGMVMGTDSVDYILLIGGLKKKRMYERAYSSMMTNAELGSGPRAVVNLITEEHVGGVPPFYIKRTLTVSGQVIEFTR